MPPRRRAHTRLRRLASARLAGLRTGTRAASSHTTRHSHRPTATEAKRPTLRTAHRPTRAPTRSPRIQPSGAPTAGRTPCALLAALDQNDRRAESVGVASSREKQVAGCEGGPAATSRSACHGQSGSHDRAGPTLAFVTPPPPEQSRRPQICPERRRKSHRGTAIPCPHSRQSREVAPPPPRSRDLHLRGGRPAAEPATGKAVQAIALDPPSRLSLPPPSSKVGGRKPALSCAGKATRNLPFPAPTPVRVEKRGPRPLCREPCICVSAGLRRKPPGPSLATVRPRKAGTFAVASPRHGVGAGRGGGDGGGGGSPRVGRGDNHGQPACDRGPGREGDAHTAPITRGMEEARRKTRHPPASRRMATCGAGGRHRSNCRSRCGHPRAAAVGVGAPQRPTQRAAVSRHCHSEQAQTKSP